MRIEISNLNPNNPDNFVVDSKLIKKMVDGIYHARVEFSKPKYFSVSTGCGGEEDESFYTITLFPKDIITREDLEDLIEVRIYPEEEMNEFGYRIFADGGRYILDAILIRNDLYRRGQGVEKSQFLQG